MYSFVEVLQVVDGCHEWHQHPVDFLDQSLLGMGTALNIREVLIVSNETKCIIDLR